MARDRPLAGVTVVSIEQAVAAPFASRQLADLGARVIKVERPGRGDFARHYDDTVKGQASYFVWLNRSKESISLDLKDSRALAIAKSLIDRADVFVQNLAPGAAARMGLSASQLRQRRPGLIVCDIVGYPSDSPDVARRAYDLLIQSETGLLSVTGTPEEPAKAGASVADISAGMYAFSSILTALYVRERSGEGAAIEVSLFESLTEWMAAPMYYGMYTGVPPDRSGTSHATIAPYGSYRTGDGAAVLFAVQNEREWRRLCEQVLRRPAMVDDARYATNVDRVANRSQLQTDIEGALSTYTAEQARASLDTAQIANGRYNTVTDLVRDSRLARRWVDVDSPGGPIHALLPPGRVADRPPVMGPIPAVGEHTDALLAELGWTPPQIEELRRSGAI